MRLVKIQINLFTLAVCTEPTLCAVCIAKNAMFFRADNKDSDQTAHMRRLIKVFFWHTCQEICFLMLRLNYVMHLLLIYLNKSKKIAFENKEHITDRKLESRFY